MYYDDWKYEPTGYELTKAEEQYEKMLKDYSKTYEELIPTSLEHAKKIESRMKDNWFSQFVDIFCKEDKEPEDERIARLCGNYLRHVIIEYDQTIKYLYKNYWVPEGYIDLLWEVAMEVIIEKYPQIQPAYERGLRIKAEYPYYKDKKLREIEEQYEKEEEIRREKELKREREKRKLETEYAGQVILKPDIKKLTVYHHGYYYNGTVIKVNRKTIKMNYKLKNGKEFTRNISKLVLYQSNHEKFTGSDEIDKFLKKRFGEEPSQKQGFEANKGERMNTVRIYSNDK